MDNGSTTSAVRERTSSVRSVSATPQPARPAISLSRDQALAMRLAGTVSVPQTFPQLGQIEFVTHGVETGVFGGRGPEALVVVRQRISPKVTITRSFLASDVAAVFVPTDPVQVSLEQGTWLTGSDIAGLDDYRPAGDEVLQGIVFVPEQAQSLLRVDAGMTAGESVDYYPPLPDDRSSNHYQLRKAASAAGLRPDEHNRSAQWPPDTTSWPSVLGDLQANSCW